MKFRARPGHTAADVSKAYGSCVGGTPLPHVLSFELWTDGDGNFYANARWAHFAALTRGVEIMRRLWDSPMVALIEICELHSVVLWLGVATELSSEFSFDDALQSYRVAVESGRPPDTPPRLLLRVKPPNSASPTQLHAYIEMYPERDSRRLSSSAGFYFNNPYSLASWTCQVPSTGFSFSSLELVAASTRPLSLITLGREERRRPIAVRLVLEGGVERVGRSGRTVIPRPEPGSLLILATREGTVRLGRCIQVSRWNYRRLVSSTPNDEDAATDTRVMDEAENDPFANHVLRHVNYSDLVHFQTNVVPLNEKAYIVAARYLHGQRPRSVELESAEALFDLSGMVVDDRGGGRIVAFRRLYGRSLGTTNR